MASKAPAAPARNDGEKQKEKEPDAAQAKPDGAKDRAKGAGAGAAGKGVDALLGSQFRYDPTCPFEIEVEAEGKDLSKHVVNGIECVVAVPKSFTVKVRHNAAKPNADKFVGKRCDEYDAVLVVDGVRVSSQVLRPDHTIEFDGFPAGGSKYRPFAFRQIEQPEDASVGLGAAAAAAGGGAGAAGAGDELARVGHIFVEISEWKTDKSIKPVPTNLRPVDLSALSDGSEVLALNAASEKAGPNGATKKVPVLAVAADHTVTVQSETVRGERGVRIATVGVRYNLLGKIPPTARVAPSDTDSVYAEYD